ncbi:unnamed protein product [Meloidogyne enterolobii]|uniref:Uncharacterized protein n=1 Tax=Meloidogyne enterolobii TaxID=390850 RepID=A0ACB0YYM4_MELEN
MLPHSLALFLSNNIHFRYPYLDCQLAHFCNGTQIYMFCYSAGTRTHPGSPWDKLSSVRTSLIRRMLIQIGTICNAISKNRRHITLTVITISTCFAISHGPSAIFSLWELLIGYKSNNQQIFTAISIANGFVLTGKTLNFLLFCLSSAHFRKKCLKIFFKKFKKKRQNSSSIERFQQSRLENKIQKEQKTQKLSILTLNEIGNEEFI